MTWQFAIPAAASRLFLQFNASNCVKKEERVEYSHSRLHHQPRGAWAGGPAARNMAGNSLNLSLQGCDQDAQNPGILRLQFQVSVQHPQNDSSK